MPPSKITIIAEAGVNHNGSFERALNMVDAAATAGADAVKFQTFKTEALVTAFAAKAPYQADQTGQGGQFEMLKALELSASAFQALMQRCTEQALEFFSTPFDRESLRLLVDLGVKRLKISSGDATNAPLLLDAARTGLPVILSTGMCTLEEVREALGALAFGYIGTGRVSQMAFREALDSVEGRAALRAKVTVLHCTTQYPTQPAEVNLRAMDTLAAAFGLPVGYSDHTAGISVAMAAAARGAALIEKHFTLDRTLPGPDHAASLEPKELSELVRSIRIVEEALGTGLKVPTEGERANLVAVRKSLVAASPIPAGEIFCPENLTCKRPATGISAMFYYDYLGRTAKRDYDEDEVISE
jgi:N-acetylneuraminate synthase